MTSSDFPEFNQLTETRFGRMLYNRNDVYIGKSIELYGEFSPGECHLFDAIIRPGMTVIEVGANIGAHTIFLARKAGPKGTVHALEPQRIVFQTLCANIALNNFTNVITHHAAAGTNPGTLLVPDLEPNARNNFGGLGLGKFESGHEVPVLTLDSLGLRRCDFVKIDVEGMEEQVLRGGEATLKKFRPILYVENDRKEKADSLVRYIRSLGYRMFAHFPPLFHPDNYRKNPENVFPNIVSKNLLCVHESKQANITGLPEVKLPEELEEK